MKSPEQSRIVTRRSFLKTSGQTGLALLTLPSLVPASVLGQKATSPNERIVVGCIGTGPQGRGVLSNFLAQSDAQVVAVSDVKKDQIEKSRQQVNQRYQDNGCATYTDFRELLARSDIDAVLIATPDHWHVHVAVAAAEAKKDMYLEKPMGLTIEEDQILRKAVHKHKRAFQFGTQQRSSRQFWRACQLVRNGHIGQLRHMNVWAPASAPGGSTEPIPVPPGIDYDMWLGPARYTPYTQDKCAESNKTWWFNSDYALGFVAGWGVHPLDIALWGCPSLASGLLEVQGMGAFPTEGACNTSIAWSVNFRCADGVTMAFKGSPNGYDRITPMNDLTAWAKRYGRNTGHGTAFEGTEGWVMVDRSGIRTYPEDLVETTFETAEVQLIQSGNHVRNLLDAVRSRETTVCSIDTAVQADILCHLSDLATRLERKLTWDTRKEKFVKDRDANKRLDLRKMRKPWRL